MSGGHAGHNHTHGMARQTLRLAFFLTFVILLANVVGGLLANSLALLSDGAHTITDLFALGLAWFATVQAERPANERKTFGYHRVGIVAALINALTLIAVVFYIGWEAIQRFQHPEPVQPLIMIIAVTGAILVNLFIAFGLRGEGDNLNVRAASLHVLGDIAASVGVIIGALLVLLTGWTLIDPLISLGIAVLVALGAWRILRETLDILLESVPEHISMPELVQDMRQVPGVKAVHDLHVWSIANGMSALSSHVLIDNLPPSASSEIMNKLTDLVREKYAIQHTTIQFECSDHRSTCCARDDLYCQLAAKREHDHAHEHDACEHDQATSSHA